MSTSARRVLVIDDDDDTLDVLELALSLEGYSVEVASNHTLGLKILQRNLPSVVLLDYSINDVTPQAFLEKLRKQSPGLPVILISGHKECAARAAELALDHFLSKPFELDVLLELIRSVEAVKSS